MFLRLSFHFCVKKLDKAWGKNDMAANWWEQYGQLMRSQGSVARRVLYSYSSEPSQVSKLPWRKCFCSMASQKCYAGRVRFRSGITWSSACALQWSIISQCMVSEGRGCSWDLCLISHAGLSEVSTWNMSPQRRTNWPIVWGTIDKWSQHQNTTLLLTHSGLQGRRWPIHRLLSPPPRKAFIYNYHHQITLKNLS